jgi:hypothetical protein
MVCDWGGGAVDVKFIYIYNNLNFFPPPRFELCASTHLLSLG